MSSSIQASVAQQYIIGIFMLQCSIAIHFIFTHTSMLLIFIARELGVSPPAEYLLVLPMLALQIASHCSSSVAK